MKDYRLFNLNRFNNSEHGFTIQRDKENFQHKGSPE